MCSLIDHFQSIFKNYAPHMPIFWVIFLLTLNFTILRSVRNTLAVADLGGGAHLIPWFELLGALPATFLMTWLLTKLMNRFCLRSVFLITLFGFLILFVLFCAVYPFLIIWPQKALCTAFSLFFYSLTELWKPALINILFWGLINNHLTIDAARNLYAFLLLGASLGALCAGPLLKICNSKASWTILHLSSRRWTHSFILIVFVLLISGLFHRWLYVRLAHRFAEFQTNSTQSPHSLFECLRTPAASKSLLLLSGIVLADYISYSLAEVIFLDVLKQKYPHPCDYCQFLGHLLFLL